MLRRKTPARRTSRRLFHFRSSGAEVLEDRCLLSVTPVQPVDSSGHGVETHTDHGPPEIPNQYIVLLRDGVNAEEFAAELRGQGRQVLHVYNNALNGLAFRGQALAHDPRVLYVEPDVVVRTADHLTPTGVDRIDADLNPLANIDDVDGTVGNGQRVDVDVAVLDTGVDLNHDDLNVYQTAFFIETSADDGHGHGTHVSGTIGALDNGIGVVGVAPGARIWAVKVLDAAGSGTASSIIGGVDYVTAHADEIDVVNMSLAGQGSSVALHQAIQNSVAAGVVYAVAAGNNGLDIYGANFALDPNDNCLLGIFCLGHEDFFPASYPEVATIAAYVDTDGQPGGQSGGTSYGPDDSFASFSNHSHNMLPDNPVYSPGLGIDLVMPGVDILSTWNDGGYNTISGTSMATPHAAGLFGLYIAQMGRDANGDGAVNGLDVSIIRQHIIDAGIAQNAAGGLSTLNDPDGNQERLGSADLNGSLFVTVGDRAITKIAESGGITTATVSRYGDVSTEVTVSLTVGDPGSVSLSTTSVTLGVGARTSAPFTITTIDNNVGDRDRVVTITAAAAGLNDGVGRVTVLDEESQWADGLVAFSSQWDSGDGSTDWMAVQALGEPDTFGYGDIPTAYAPATPDGGTEWITVAFDTPVFAGGAVVRESFFGGFVTQIEARQAGTNSYTTVWQGVDNSPDGVVVDFQANWTPTAFLVDALRVTMNTAPAGWEEIDAIQLLGAASVGGDTDPPSVTVNSPNGDEEWPAGSMQTITWTATDDVGVTSVDLLYSTDGGGSFTTIATGEANDGTFNWNVPQIVTSSAVVKVVARDAAFNSGEDVSDAAFTISDATAPTVAVTAPNGGESWAAGSVHAITWTASDNIDVTSIDLSYSTDGGGSFTTIATGEADDGSYSWSVPNDPGTNVVVRVVAYDAAGNSANDVSDAAFTITVPDTTPPAAPASLVVSVPVSNGGLLNLDWADNGDGDLAGYNVYRRTSSETYSLITFVGTSSYADSGLVNGTTYFYVVTAVDTSGNASGDSNEDSGTPLDNLVPAAPSNLTATAGNAQVSLDWDDNGESDLAGYNVYRSETSGGSYTKIASIGAISAYTDATASNDTTYFYVVTAVDGAGNESGNSNEATATPQVADQMYINDIIWSEKHKGKGGAITDLLFTVDVHFDSDHDGVAENSDAALAGVTTTVSLSLDAHGDGAYDDGMWGASALTAGNGMAKFVLNDAPDGDYFLIVAIEHPDYAWNILIGASFFSFYDGVPGGSERTQSGGSAIQSFAAAHVAASAIDLDDSGPLEAPLSAVLAEDGFAWFTTTRREAVFASFSDASTVPTTVIGRDDAVGRPLVVLDQRDRDRHDWEVTPADDPQRPIASVAFADPPIAATAAAIDELFALELSGILDGA